jgi:hypothetical protein
MLQPFLLVGVGGSGGKTLRAIRRALELRLQQEDWRDGWPKAWQMLHVDSPVSQDGAAFPAPFLPSENYFGLVAPGTTYKQAFGAVMANIPSEHRADVERPMPSDKEVAVQVGIGAGKFRGVGRTLVLAKFNDVSNAVSEAFSKMTSEGAIGQLDTLGRKLGAKPAAGEPRPIVIVVSSIAGGSGAGQYMEVTEAIKFANRNAPWIHSIFSILYAPDVFKSVGNTDVIAPNALYAMSESMAGMWTNDLSESTQALYKKMGINIPGLGTDPQVHIGPRFNYVIGRENSKVSFDDQPDVYKAVAASLSTWMTDENVQDGLQAYTVANFAADMGALALTDNSGLQVMNKHTPPFGSLGFGRISLGRDKFSDYAAERLARTVIDRMLYAHSDGEDTSTKTEDQWVRLKAEQSFADFLSDLHLSHPSEHEYQVVRETHVDFENVWSGFRSQIEQYAAQGLSPKSGGQPATQWVQGLQIAFGDRAANFGASAQNTRNELVRGWIEESRTRTLAVVGRYAAQQGIKIAIELLRRTEEEIGKQTSQLLKAKSDYSGYSASYNSEISNAFETAQDNQAIKPTDPWVENAFVGMRNAFWYYIEGEHSGYVAGLLDDFSVNFLRSLRETISQAELALIKRTEKDSNSDYVQNAYLDWPKPETDSVPPKYKGAPNEYLLVATEEYPKEYKRLISESVETDRRGSARQVVINEILMGSLLLDNLDPQLTWSLISEEKRWVPIERTSREEASQAQQPSRFIFSSDPEEYLKRTVFWLSRKGQAFYKYLHDDLNSYLDANVHDAATIVDRQRELREQFLEAVRASEPLVKLNPGLLQEVHNSTIDERQTVLSAIPFDTGSAAYAAVKEILVQQKVWVDQTSDSWFKPSARVQNIDIFSVQRPYQPIVMDSIFNPIAESWHKAQNSQDKREAFFQWRRSRSLWESVPAAPEKKSAVLRGWFLARAFGQLSESLEDPKRGPELKVWSQVTRNYESFPYPLASGKVVEPEDYPGAILMSLSIALAMCNASSSLVPLLAYRRLMELGEISTLATSELNRWISQGTVSHDSQPAPGANAGPTGVDSVEARRSALVEYFNKILKEFSEDIESLDTHTQWEKLGYTWEVRGEVRKALEDLISACSQAKAARSGIN